MTAINTFMQKKAEIDELLERIQKASENHFDTNPDAINWGDAGSLDHAAGQLEEIARFLNV